MAVVSIARARGVARGYLPPFETVVMPLAVVSLLELLILRTFTRTAIHIPALNELATPYEFLSFFGRYVYYLAALLLVLALPLAALALWRQADLPARVGAVAVAGFIGAAAFARAGPGSPLLADTLTVCAVTALSLTSTSRLDWRAALGFAIFAAAFAALAAHTLLQTAASEGAPAYDARALLYVGEFAAVVFAVSSPWTMRAAPGRRASTLAVAVGVVSFALLVGGASTTKVLLLWNEGLAGTYPSVVYAAAAASLLATLVGLAARPSRMPAVGFLLLITGGFGLHSTYQTGLVLVGLATLALSLPAVRHRSA